jgi:hypothetical protein
LGIKLEITETRTPRNTKISEKTAKNKIAELEITGAESHNAQDEAPCRHSAPKDLLLVALVPKWSGTETAIPLNEFFKLLRGLESAIGQKPTK